jgi:hypothetical protein
VGRQVSVAVCWWVCVCWGGGVLKGAGLRTGRRGPGMSLEFRGWVMGVSLKCLCTSSVFVCVYGQWGQVMPDAPCRVLRIPCSHSCVTTACDVHYVVSECQQACVLCVPPSSLLMLCCFELLASAALIPMLIGLAGRYKPATALPEYYSSYSRSGCLPAYLIIQASVVHAAFSAGC